MQTDGEGRVELKDYGFGGRRGRPWYEDNDTSHLSQWPRVMGDGARRSRRDRRHDDDGPSEQSDG